MTIIKMLSGHADTYLERSSEFAARLREHVNKKVLYRGIAEAGPMKVGILKNASWDIVSISREFNDEVYVYPIWDILVAV